MKNETKEAPKVDKSAVRVCHADDGENPKGKLALGAMNDKTAGKGYQGFDGGEWENEGTNRLILNDYWSKNKDQDIEINLRIDMIKQNGRRQEKQRKNYLMSEN